MIEYLPTGTEPEFALRCAGVLLFSVVMCGVHLLTPFLQQYKPARHQDPLLPPVVTLHPHQVKNQCISSVIVHAK